MLVKFAVTTALSLACLAAPAADVDAIIAQFPAESNAAANTLFDALLAEGEDALESVCDRLVPLGQGDDNAARYALTGLARYVSRPGADDARALVEEVLLEGVEDAEDAEVRAFLVRQLQQCGTNDSVGDLGDLLQDEAMASHAILALDAIGTRKARRALSRGLKQTSGDTQLAILAAMADDGRSWRATRTVRERLEARPEANEYVHLLSLLAAIAGDRAQEEYIAAMDREEPRVRKAALTHAAATMDDRDARKWRKKMTDDATSDEVKSEIARLLAPHGDSRL